MTSVGSVSSSPTYAQIIANAQKLAQTLAATGTAADSAAAKTTADATTVTLSDAAKAALAAEKDFATVGTDARATLDGLLAAAKRSSPLEAGKLVLNLSAVDRRELFAISTNANQQFSVDEQKAAAIELQSRFDQALAGPTAVGRVTGSIKGLYVAALAYFDAMGPEEKAAATYADQRAALKQTLAAIEADPSTLPADPDDPVNAYLARLAEGETGELRDIVSVAGDARATLDSQYAAGARAPDYADFDSRSLAAVALNANGEFSATEIRAAAAQMRTRSGAALLASLKNADAGNPAAFAENVIALFGAMSAEERTAAGWSNQLYEAAVANYRTASKLSSLLGAATGSSAFDTSDSTAGSMSLVDYL